MTKQFTGGGHIAPHQKTRFKIDPAAQLIVRGRLRTSMHDWEGAPMSLIQLDAGSCFEVLGKVEIHYGASIICRGGTLTWGSGAVNTGVRIRCASAITIGEDAMLGADLVIFDSDFHQLSGSAGTQPVHIGNHVWTGIRCTILKGVTIGDGCVIGAGSVVTRSIPPQCLAAGNPARVIREGVTWR